MEAYCSVPIVPFLRCIQSYLFGWWLCLILEIRNMYMKDFMLIPDLIPPLNIPQNIFHFSTASFLPQSLSLRFGNKYLVH